MIRESNELRIGDSTLFLVYSGESMMEAMGQYTELVGSVGKETRVRIGQSIFLMDIEEVTVSTYIDKPPKRKYTNLYLDNKPVDLFDLVMTFLRGTTMKKGHNPLGMMTPVDPSPTIQLHKVWVRGILK